MPRVVTVKSSLGRRIDELERVSSMAYERSRSVRDPLAHPSWITAISGGAAAAQALSPAATEPLPQLNALALAYPEEDLSTLLTAGHSTLAEVQDGRLFHPEGDLQPLRDVRSRPVRRMSKVPESRPLASISVPAADQVIMCIRRKARRGVILALGQGGGFHRKPRRSPKSDIWC